MDCEKLTSLLENVQMAVSTEHSSNNVDTKFSAMSDLSIYLNSFSTKQISDYEQAIPFEMLFHYLETVEVESGSDRNRKLCKATCEVLRIFLEVLEPETVFEKFHNELLGGMRHTQGEVRQLCCIQLERIWSIDKSSLTNEPQFLELLIDCMCDEEDSSGAHRTAHQLLVNIGISEAGGEALFSTRSLVLTHFKNSLTRHSSTVWFRLMEVVIQCCSQQLNSFKLCKENDLLQKFIGKVKDSSDILSQSVAIEMLEVLARTDDGYEWLFEQDVMADVVAMLDDEENPLAAIIQPAALKFFGGVTLKYPDKVYNNNDKYFDKLCAIITDTRVDDPLLLNALDSLTATASTNQGKRVLNKIGPKFTQTLRRVGGLARDSRSDTRLVALCCMEKLMRLEMSSNLTGVSAICENWYQNMDTQPLEFLLQMSKAPFQEPKLAVLRIYQSLAAHCWAQKLMRDHSTFMEYLLDRDTESDKEGHLLKYDVISTIVKSDTASQVFPAPTLIKLKLYEREGPFYAQAQSRIATDEG